MKNSYASLFIELGKYAAITTLVIGGLVTTAAIASSKNIKVAKNVKLEATSAQLAIKSPECQRMSCDRRDRKNIHE